MLIDDPALSGTATSAPQLTGDAMPKQFSLGQNYPNPFNPSTTIEFSLPQSGYTTLKVYSAIGTEVATLASDDLSAGTYKTQWNASALPSGVYFYRLQSASLIETKKLVLLK